MKEILDIIEAYGKISFSGRKAALATVVRVEGSSYRQPGARMLISEDGTLTGAISGGCLEGDALRKALLVIARGKPMLVTYDTTDENDAQLGIGLGCNGIIHILIEPIDPLNPDNPVQILKAVVKKRQKAVLITLFSMPDNPNNQIGTCMAFADNGDISGVMPDEIPGDILIPGAKQVLVKGNSVILNVTFEGRIMSALVERINPVVSLVIAGAGNDVMPLVKFADLLAWQVTVLDGRPSYASCRRFPEAHQVLVTNAEEALSQITIDEFTVFVLMTHNYNYDLALLRQLISQQTTYIGVLGPKKKLERLLQEIQPVDDGQDPYKNVYGPVGLDIGAETAEEIALSVIAEIRAVLAGRPGISLRGKNTSIHSPTHEEEIAILKTQAELQHV